ncbi:MAG: hypothetical protein JW738_10475 [Actinobacteria bacterium]|nr:hypothetical protein [Actinomycetota bacterium]
MNDEIKSAATRGDIKHLLEIIYCDQLDTRKSAIEAIAGVGGRKAVKALLGVARDRAGLKPELRLHALESLGTVSGKLEYLSILDEFIDGDNRKVVLEARRMFRQIDPVDLPLRLVEKACLDHQAISTYSRYREPGAVALLDGFFEERIVAGDVLTTPYWGRVYVAVRALGKIEGKEAVHALDKIDRWLHGRTGRREGFLQSERASKLKKAVGLSLRSAGKE